MINGLNCYDPLFSRALIPFSKKTTEDPHAHMAPPKLGVTYGSLSLFLLFTLYCTHQGTYILNFSSCTISAASTYTPILLILSWLKRELLVFIHG